MKMMQDVVTYDVGGPVRSLSEVAYMLWENGFTSRILPRSHVGMIEKRALAKLRRHPKMRRLARELWG